MTAAQYRRERRQDASAIADTCIAAMLWALHNTEGFGEKRLARVLEESDRIADFIADRCLTPDDIYQTLEDETGLKFVTMREEQAMKKGKAKCPCLLYTSEIFCSSQF